MDEFLDKFMEAVKRSRTDVLRGLAATGNELIMSKWWENPVFTFITEAEFMEKFPEIR